MNHDTTMHFEVIPRGLSFPVATEELFKLFEVADTGARHMKVPQVFLTNQRDKTKWLACIFCGEMANVTPPGMALDLDFFGNFLEHHAKCTCPATPAHTCGLKARRNPSNHAWRLVDLGVRP